MRGKQLVVGCGIAVAVVVTAGLAPAGAAGGAASRAVGTTWVKVSNGAIGNIIDPDVARFGSDLQVIWTEQTTSSPSYRVATRILSASGQPVSPITGVASSWASLNEFPALIANGNQRVVVFSGIRSTDSSDPYSQGYDYYATSPDGTSWTVANGTIGSSKSAYASYGSDAVDAGGTPISVFVPGTSNDVAFHSGFDALPPVNPDGSSTHNPTCCAYYAGAGYDATSGQTWTAWYSNSGKATTDGINAQQIAPALGTMVHAPQSTVVSNGSASSIAPIQRVQVASRTSGGLFTAYVVGYLSPTKVALWRLGGSAPLVLSSGHGVAQVGVATGPGGRMWLFWWESSSTKLHAVRTNAAVSRFGRTCTVTIPQGTSTIWKTAGNGVAGPLDLVVNAGNSDGEIYSTLVKPCLSASVSPASVKSASGGSVTVHVTDAGTPVAGAKVTYAGVSKTTNSSGNATVKVAKGTKRGKHTASFSAAGYTGGTVTFRVS